MTSTVSVHRCRFVDYTPTPITAIALPPLPLAPVNGKRKNAATLSSIFGFLAVGRANGNVELHRWTGLDPHAQAPQAWVIQKVLPGPVPSKVDNLVFALRHKRSDSEILQLKDLRLFSTGGGSEVVEWDLESGGIIRSVSSQAGSIWSIAVNPSSTLVALGCEDGSVRILSLEDDDLVHYRRLDRVKSRLLSIAWGPPMMKRFSRRETGNEDSSSEDETDLWVDSWLVAGCSDSSLRKFDFSSGRMLDRMTTDKLRGERTLVWAVCTLGDGTIVSGDSLGFVKFWDSNTCTQLQSFQTHGADVLCLTIGPEGKSIYSSGVDQKVCQFSNVQVVTATGTESSALSRRKWIYACSRRLHSHDVRAISVWPPYSLRASSYQPSSSSEIAPLLVSGGFDMSLVVCPCALPSLGGADQNVVNPLASISPTFEDGCHQRLPYTTGMSPAVQVAREGKLVLCRRDTGLTIWKIKKSIFPGEIGLSNLEMSEKDRGNDWERLVDMELKATTNLLASAIANDGSWVAASDLRETKLYRLTQSKIGLRPKRVKITYEPNFPAQGATSLLFTSDSSKLIIGASMGSSLVTVVDLVGEENSNPRVLRTFEHHRMQNIIVGSKFSRAIKNLPGHPDVNGDTLHQSEDDLPDEVDEWSRSQAWSGPSVASTITCMAASMDGQWLASADTRHRIHVFNLDSVQHHCALPSFPHAITALAFDPGSPATLVIGLANNTLQAFDVESRQFPEWSRVWLQESSTPFSHIRDPLVGISFDPGVSADMEATGGRRALVWGNSWMCKVKLAASVSKLSKKRRRDSKRSSVPNGEVVPRIAEAGLVAQDSENRPGFHVVTRYRPLLVVEYLGPRELLVVERPMVDLLSTLPPAYFRYTYGS